MPTNFDKIKNMNIDEMVLPMVPAGKPIDELLLEVE